MSAEVILLAMYVSSMAGLLLFIYCFGLRGAVAYSALAGVIANLQVLKTTQFFFFDQPVALGTVVFTSLFVVSDILTECAGPKVARHNVRLSLTAMILVLLWMVLTMAYPPAQTPHNLKIQGAMEHLFWPHVPLTLASLIAYVISQYNDIWIFHTLKKVPWVGGLGRRSLISTAISGFIDQLIFSTLAWVVLTTTPLPFHQVWWTYIIGTYGFRLAVSFSSVPIVILARRLLGDKPLT